MPSQPLDFLLLFLFVIVIVVAGDYLIGAIKKR
jgi:hypothetical protein